MQKRDYIVHHARGRVHLAEARLHRLAVRTGARYPLATGLQGAQGAPRFPVAGGCKPGAKLCLAEQELLQEPKLLSPPALPGAVGLRVLLGVHGIRRKGAPGPPLPHEFHFTLWGSWCSWELHSAGTQAAKAEDATDTYSIRAEAQLPSDSALYVISLALRRLGISRIAARPHALCDKWVAPERRRTPIET